MNIKKVILVTIVLLMIGIGLYFIIGTKDSSYEDYVSSEVSDSLQSEITITDGIYLDTSLEAITKEYIENNLAAITDAGFVYSESNLSILSKSDTSIEYLLVNDERALIIRLTIENGTVVNSFYEEMFGS